MLLALVDSFGYRVMFLLHIAAIVVAFAPAFVNPVLSARYRKAGEPMPSTLTKILADDTYKIHGPALVLAGVFGFGMIGMSDKVWKFSQSWVSIAFGLWFVMLGIVFGLLGPAEKKQAAGEADAEKKVAMFGGIMHLLFLLMLIVMIWKPGL